MLTLRLTQHAEPEANHYRVELALEENGRRLATATSRFPLALTAQDAEDLRWYFEDYAENPFEPERQIAERIVRRMQKIGVELFQGVFQADAR